MSYETKKRQMARERDEKRLTDCYFTLPFFHIDLQRERQDTYYHMHIGNWK